ncbi:DUF317 domain-containing protein [Streptomyces sp. NPDC013130]|uniref:DUF317 domain-containing protein n=2 Tax=unclassified Streptomyces TaxID=2593676 RepID=UPI0029A2445D|nr:DUF317 domain-containing protein [Streptomyces sp. WI03-5b]
MPVSERQLAAFAHRHATQLPFDTSPRHLAGPGDARHVTHGLAAAGWTCTSDPLSPEIVLRSPDHRYSMQFDPQSATSAWWRLQAEPTRTERGWYAEFGELVPAEILGRLTDALIAPTPTEHADPFQALESAGWTLESETTAHSPDGMCHVHRPTDEGVWRSSWRVESCQPGFETPMGPRIWHAFVDESMPEHLVCAFAAALADPAPLQRAMYDRTAHYSAVQSLSRLTPEDVVAAHSTRLDAIRAQARAARRQQRTQPAVTPATARAVRPAVRR